MSKNINHLAAFALTFSYWGYDQLFSTQSSSVYNFLLSRLEGSRQNTGFLIFAMLQDYNHQCVCQ